MKILDIFGKGKKAKNEKDDINNVAEDNAPAYHLPYYLQDEPKKKSKKATVNKPDTTKADAIATVSETKEESKAPAKATSAKSATAKKNDSGKTTQTKKATDKPAEKSATKTTPKKPTEAKSGTNKTESSAAKATVKKSTSTKPAEDKKEDVKIEKSPAKTAAKKSAATKPDTETKDNAKAEKQSTNAPAKKSTTTKPIEENKDLKDAKTTTKSTAKKPAEPKPQKVAEASTEKATTAVEKNEVKSDAPSQKPQRTGKFEIKKSKDGRFVFNLYASNNVIVATSQIYTSSTSAMNGIKSVIANAETSPVEDQTLKNVQTLPYPKWEIYQDKGEQYRFRLCASNGSCVCHSQGYTSKTNCKKGIESIIKFAKDADITKVYLDKKDK